MSCYDSDPKMIFDLEAVMPGSHPGPTVPSTSYDCVHHQRCT